MANCPYSFLALPPSHTLYSSLRLITLPAMLFTVVLLALAAASPVLSAVVPSTQDVSSEKVSLN